MKFSFHFRHNDYKKSAIEDTIDIQPINSIYGIPEKFPRESEFLPGYVLYNRISSQNKLKGTKKVRNIGYQFMKVQILFTVS